MNHINEDSKKTSSGKIGENGTIKRPRWNERNIEKESNNNWI